MLTEILIAIAVALAGGLLYTIVGIIPGTDETATMVPITIILVLAAKFFEVYEDPRIGEVTDTGRLTMSTGDSVLLDAPVDDLARAFKATLDW